MNWGLLLGCFGELKPQHGWVSYSNSHQGVAFSTWATRSSIQTNSASVDTAPPNFGSGHEKLNQFPASPRNQVLSHAGQPWIPNNHGLQTMPAFGRNHGVQTIPAKGCAHTFELIEGPTDMRRKEAASTRASARLGALSQKRHPMWRKIHTNYPQGDA